MNIFEWLQNWYISNCDGEWEHWKRIKISTVDILRLLDEKYLYADK